MSIMSQPATAVKPTTGDTMSTTPYFRPEDGEVLYPLASGGWATSLPTEGEPYSPRLLLTRHAGIEADDLTTFGEWVAQQAAKYRTLGTDAALLVAEAIDELLSEIQITRASNPDQLRDRRAVLTCIEPFIG